MSTVRAPDSRAWATRRDDADARPETHRSRHLVFAAVLAVILVAAAATWLHVVARLRAPQPIATHGTPAAIVWADRVFRSEAELASYLRKRGVAYDRWARAHPAAVGVLRFRNRASSAPRVKPRAAGSSAAPAAPPRATPARPPSKSPPASAAAPRQALEDESPLAPFALGLVVLGLVVAAAAAVAAGRAPGLRLSAPRLPSLRLPPLRRPLLTLVRSHLRPAAAIASEHLGRLRVGASRRVPSSTEARPPGRVVDDILEALSIDAPVREPTDTELRRTSARPGEAAATAEAPATPAAAAPAVGPAAVEPKPTAAGKAMPVPDATAALKASVTPAPPKVAPERAPRAPVDAELESKLVAPGETPAAAAQQPRPRREPARREPARRFVAGPAVPASEVAPAAVLAAAPECEVRWWRGYLKSQFYAVATNAVGAEVTLAQSPFFRWRQGTPPPKEPAAAEALDALVASLEQAGWSVVGRRSGDWFAVRLRLAGAASPAEACSDE